MTFRTERAAWTAIADTLDMLQEMPPTWWNQHPAFGLCAVVDTMRLEELISRELAARMHVRIAQALAPGQSFLATPGEWAPRVKWARTFAAASARRSRR